MKTSEIRVWQALGVACLLGALLVLAALIPIYQHLQAYGSWRETQETAMLLSWKVWALAGFSQMLGLVMLGVSRGMKAATALEAKTAALQANGFRMALPWCVIASCLAILVWIGIERGPLEASLLVVEMMAALWLAGSIALVGAERLVRHVSRATS
jgi:hypothetical protein